MRTIHLTPEQVLTDEQLGDIGGEMLDDSSYDILIDEDATVYKPDGEPLVIFRKDVLSAKTCQVAWQNLRDAARETDNRGMAGGKVDESKLPPWVRIGEATRTRFKERLKDGSISKTTRANPVRSGVVGYFDRSSRFPYCRTTAYNLQRGHQFQESIPFIREIDNVFKREHPSRYAAQKAFIEQTSADFYIPGTVFTTVTVNKNWQTAVHKDVGDLAEGFGVMTAMCAGEFDGCYLCFPQYRVAVNMRTADVLLADVHEWHGNTPFHGIPGSFERLSFVLYYRERMRECGTAAEELERAKRNEVWAKGPEERK